MTLAILIKTDYVGIEFGHRYEFIHWPIWKPEPAAGDEAFVVFSETSSPLGLLARGLISDVTKDGKIALGFHAAQVGPTAPLTIEFLKGIPRADTSTMEGRLAQKLYWHAHNKICPLDAEESDFLRVRFARV